MPDGDQKKRTMNTAAKQRSMITPHLRALRRILRTRPRIRKLPLSMVALFVGQPGQHRLLLPLQVMCQDGCSERNVVCFVERAAVRRNRRTSAGGARLDAGQLPTISPLPVELSSKWSRFSLHVANVPLRDGMMNISRSLNAMAVVLRPRAVR